MPDGTLIRYCPNCHEGLRVTSGRFSDGISLIGRKANPVPQADGDDGDGETLLLGPEEEKDPILRLLDTIQQAEMMARDMMLAREEGPQPGPIEVDKPYGIPEDAVPADFGVDRTESIGEGRDPWTGRSELMRCRTCICYVEKKAAAEGGVEIGRCRRRAPTMDGYPVVFPYDWCFEHKLDETKV